MENQGVLTRLKIILLGETGVGKTSLMLRFSDDTFDKQQRMITEVDFKLKKIAVEGYEVELAIWDTGGQERLHTLIPGYYRGAQGALLVYDAADRGSLTRLEKWLAELKKYSTKPNMVKMLVGNKVDKETLQVSRQEGLQVAVDNAMLFNETSAQTRQGVDSTFEILAQKFSYRSSIPQAYGIWTNALVEAIHSPLNWKIKNTAVEQTS